MAIKPSALVISVTEENPLHVIKRKKPLIVLKPFYKHEISVMLDVEELPEAIVLDGEIHAYPLHIDTKYYSADINLCTMKSKTIGCREFAEGVGAAIIKFDSDKVSFSHDYQ